MENTSSSLIDLLPTETLAELQTLVTTVGGTIVVIAAVWAGVRLIKRAINRV